MSRTTAAAADAAGDRNGISQQQVGDRPVVMLAAI